MACTLRIPVSCVRDMEGAKCGRLGVKGVFLENPLNQRRRRTEFWEAKTTEQLKLKGLYKGEKVLLR